MECGCDISLVSVRKRSGNYYNLLSTSVCCISGKSAESHVKTRQNGGELPLSVAGENK